MFKGFKCGFLNRYCVLVTWKDCEYDRSNGERVPMLLAATILVLFLSLILSFVHIKILSV